MSVTFRDGLAMALIVQSVFSDIFLFEVESSISTDVTSEVLFVGVRVQDGN
jgi:hypothetical protein